LTTSIDISLRGIKMPRQARKRSESGIYHVMLRGINRQTIFEDEEDYNAFIETIAIYKSETNTCIYGYCLMKNHVHLLLKSNKPCEFMRKIGAGYVYWYNWKYDRVGSLFQDRYKSEVVEDDEYFLTVLRHIHQNPIKAKVKESIDEYKYSSYNEYLKRRKRIIDADFVLRVISLERFIEFHREINDDKYLDIVEVHRINDETAKSIIYRVSKCKTPS
jgi:putative transposase